MYVLRTDTFAKLFFLISFSGLLMYAVLGFYTFHKTFSSLSKMEKLQVKIQSLPDPDFGIQEEVYDKSLKYILIWTTSEEYKAWSLISDDDINSVVEGHEIFVNNNCSYTNCFMSTNKNLLNKDYSNFDAVIFNISIIKSWMKRSLPTKRNMIQKYIFYSMKSSNERPLCNIYIDDFFNLTWTYKLNSDIVSPFIEVKDTKGHIVAPKEYVNWITSNVTNVNKGIVNMKSKKNALAWVVQNCYTSTNRMLFAKELQATLKRRSLVFDIYGCGMLQCPKDSCLKGEQYYFYLASESSFAEDYVTDEVLKAYKYNAVPIVSGGADYYKFLPKGSYINMGSASADKLATIINYAIKNPNLYTSFFKWKKYYKVQEANTFQSTCDLCEHLNEKKNLETVKKNFRKWWYSGPLSERCYPRGAESFKDILSYLNSSRVIG